MKNRLKSAAKWMKENPDLVIIGTMYSAVIGGTVWIVRAAVKADEEYIQEYREIESRRDKFIDESYSSGNLPFSLSDGSILSIPKETDFKVMI